MSAAFPESLQGMFFLAELISQKCSGLCQVVVTSSRLRVI